MSNPEAKMEVRFSEIEQSSVDRSNNLDTEQFNKQQEELTKSRDSKEAKIKMTIQIIKETKHLLDIFPVEIWEIIWEQLQDTADLHNVWQSSSLFRDLLNHQRQYFLFQEVWEVLGLKYEQSSDLSYRHHDLSKPVPGFANDTTGITTICVSCGRRRKPQWFSGILSLRLVCKSWSQTITSFYQNHPNLFRYEIHSKSVLCSKTHWSQTFFTEDKETVPSSFLLHFTKTHGDEGLDRSPFLGSRISIAYGDNFKVINEMNQEQFRNGVRTLIKKYGRHLRSLTLHNFGRISDTIYNYTIIHYLLHRMPNLEALRMKTEGSSNKTRGQNDQLIAASISSRPMPNLSGLKFLSAYNINDDIFKELIRSNNRISKMEITGAGIEKIYLEKTFQTRANFQ